MAECAGGQRVGGCQAARARGRGCGSSSARERRRRSLHATGALSPADRRQTRPTFARRGRDRGRRRRCGLSGTETRPRFGIQSRCSAVACSLRRRGPCPEPRPHPAPRASRTGRDIPPLGTSPRGCDDSRAAWRCSRHRAWFLQASLPRPEIRRLQNAFRPATLVRAPDRIRPRANRPRHLLPPGRPADVARLRSGRSRLRRLLSDSCAPSSDYASSMRFITRCKTHSPTIVFFCTRCLF